MMTACRAAGSPRSIHLNEGTSPNMDKLNVTLYALSDARGAGAAEFSEGLTAEVEYVSYFNGGTHGPPALVAPGRQDGRPTETRARIGDRVLYVNTSLVP